MLTTVDTSNRMVIAGLAGLIALVLILGVVGAIANSGGGTSAADKQAAQDRTERKRQQQAEQSDQDQADLFRKRGAEVLHGPTMRTIDLTTHDALRDVTRALVDRPPDYLVVTTGMGLRMWTGAAAGWGIEAELMAALANARIVARGA